MRSETRGGWAASLAIAAVTVAAYAASFSAPFVFDDLPAIPGNASIRHWATAWLPPANTTASGRPGFNLTLALNYGWGGTGVAGYHAFNLAIHLLAGAVLYGVVRRALEALRSERAALTAGIAAGGWLLHPLQTEAVTYVAQRAESLMGLCYLLTLDTAARSAQAGTRRSRLGWGVAAVAACAFGMATKEVMVSAPLAVLGYDRTFLAGSFRKALRQRRGLYLGLVATWLVLVPLVLGTHGRSGTSGFGSGVSWGGYLLTQGPAVLRYLRLVVWPAGLIFDYGARWGRGAVAAIPSCAAVVALAAFSVWAFLRRGAGWRAAGLCGMMFFAILAPTSLIPGNRQTAAEHRMYLAMAPVLSVLAWFLVRRMGRKALGVAGMAGLVLAGLTWERNQDYLSALRLWEDTVAKNPGNPQAQDNLGNALAGSPGRLPEAIGHFEAALRLEPDLADAHNNLGNAWAQTPGRDADAVAEYRRALALDAALPETHNNLANVLNAQGRMLDAVDEYEAALRLDPADVAAHVNLAITLLNLPGRQTEAVSHLRTSLRLDPNQALPREILASLQGSSDLRPH